MSQAKYLWTRVTEQGRVELPAEVRESLGIKDGDKLAFVVEGDEVSLMTVRQGIRRAQGLPGSTSSETPAAPSSTSS